MVPVLFAVGALDSGETGSHAATPGFGLAVGQAVLAVVGIVALGRLVLRPLFRSVARTRSEELFVAACLLVVIATALATAAAGLSMALGALIGGLLLAGTEYRRQVEVTIEPFKGLLVGVFLISVGMSLDIRMVATHPLLILVAPRPLVLLKAADRCATGAGFRPDLGDRPADRTAARAGRRVQLRHRDRGARGPRAAGRRISPAWC